MASAKRRIPKRTVRTSAEFVRWRDTLAAFELDGQRLYLPTGDIPMDEDELLEHWAKGSAAPAEPEDAGT